MSANPKKYTNLTKEDIKKYLGELNEVIKCNKYQISNRDKNNEFINKYNLKSKKILLELNVLDFCYAEENDKMNGETLYIFCKEYQLDNWGIMEKVKIYIKINKVPFKDKNGEYVFIVSFHKPERDIKFLFR